MSNHLMKSTKKDRLSNFELIRIVAMCFIVISHYAQHGLLPMIESKTTIVQFLTMYFQTLGAIGVTLFVLLTGYFMIDKSFNLKHFFSIALETLFYSWGIFFIFALFFKDYIILSPKIIYQSILPILTGQYWFVTAYLLLYLAIPFLNKLFNILDKKTLSRYLLLFIFLWFVIPLLGYKIKIVGSNFDNLVCLYFIGAYIKRYGLSFFEKRVNALSVIFISESIICLYQLVFIVIHFFNNAWFLHLSGVNSIFTVFTAVAVFMLLKNLKIDYSPIINYFASSAFAVYLITENICMRKVIWSNIFHCNHSPNLLYCLVNMAFALIISYFVCVFIDKFRALFFAKGLLCFVENQYNKVCSFITKFV